MSVSMVAQGLAFPEGPVALPDGDVLVVEVAAGLVTRVSPVTGEKRTVADCGGGPNGAAIGPDGKVYVCNNGGLRWRDERGFRVPAGVAEGNEGGSIQRVDLDSGKVETLYDSCDGRLLRGPNDIVFDDLGGFYFTDYGRGYERAREFGGVYYARPDGSEISEVIYPLGEPNGIGLTPSGNLVVALTPTRSIWQWELKEAGVVSNSGEILAPGGGTLVCGLPGHQPVDSLAVDSEGKIWVGTLSTGCVTVVSTTGEIVDQVMPIERDPFVTNVCFAGLELRMAYFTASGSGCLYRAEPVTPGLPLNHGYKG
jgi:gluconolactonase